MPKKATVNLDVSNAQDEGGKTCNDLIKYLACFLAKNSLELVALSSVKASGASASNGADTSGIMNDRKYTVSLIQLTSAVLLFGGKVVC